MVDGQILLANLIEETIKTIRHGRDTHENNRKSKYFITIDPSITIHHGPLPQYLMPIDQVQTKIFLTK